VVAAGAAGRGCGTAPAGLEAVAGRAVGATGFDGTSVFAVGGDFAAGVGAADFGLFSSELMIAWKSMSSSSTSGAAG
jgi:hypothetical protein